MSSPRRKSAPEKQVSAQAFASQELLAELADLSLENRFLHREVMQMYSVFINSLGHLILNGTVYMYMRAVFSDLHSAKVLRTAIDGSYFEQIIKAKNSQYSLIEATDGLDQLVDQYFAGTLPFTPTTNQIDSYNTVMRLRNNILKKLLQVAHCHHDFSLDSANAMNYSRNKLIKMFSDIHEPLCIASITQKLNSAKAITLGATLPLHFMLSAMSFRAQVYWHEKYHMPHYDAKFLLAHEANQYIEEYKEKNAKLNDSLKKKNFYSSTAILVNLPFVAYGMHYLWTHYNPFALPDSTRQIIREAQLENILIETQLLSAALIGSWNIANIMGSNVRNYLLSTINANNLTAELNAKHDMWLDILAILPHNLKSEIKQGASSALSRIYFTYEYADSDRKLYHRNIHIIKNILAKYKIKMVSNGEGKISFAGDENINDKLKDTIHKEIDNVINIKLFLYQIKQLVSAIDEKLEIDKVPCKMASGEDGIRCQIDIPLRLHDKLQAILNTLFPTANVEIQDATFIISGRYACERLEFNNVLNEFKLSIQSAAKASLSSSTSFESENNNNSNNNNTRARKSKPKIDEAKVEEPKKETKKVESIIEKDFGNNIKYNSADPKCPVKKIEGMHNWSLFALTEADFPRMPLTHKYYSNLAAYPHKATKKLGKVGVKGLSFFHHVVDKDGNKIAATHELKGVKSFGGVRVFGVEDKNGLITWSAVGPHT